MKMVSWLRVAYITSSTHGLWDSAAWSTAASSHYWEDDLPLDISGEDDMHRINVANGCRS